MGINQMTNETKPIKAAAIKLNEQIFTLPKPSRHADIISYMLTPIEQGGAGQPNARGGECGFITEADQFVTRWRALRIAKYYNQLLEGHTGFQGELYTNDLWKD